jgi:hypothetical protein
MRGKVRGRGRVQPERKIPVRVEGEEEMRGKRRQSGRYT